VFLVPAFAGLGAPHWDPEARGALLGLTRGTGRGHIARAALEGIAFQCTELIEALRQDTGLAVDELLVDGGAAANDLLMQLQADLAGVRVRRPEDLESTARGAAALAAVGAGVIMDPAEALGMQAGVREFLPGLDALERERRLAEWAAAVARVRSS
jgi:glycerol kinase